MTGFPSTNEEIRTLVLADPAVSDCVVLDRMSGSGLVKVLYLVANEPISRVRTRLLQALAGQTLSFQAFASLPRNSAGNLELDSLTAIPLAEEADCERLEHAACALLGAGEALARLVERGVDEPLHLAKLLPDWHRSAELPASPTQPNPFDRETTAPFANEVWSYASGPELVIPKDAPRNLQEVLARAARGNKGITYLNLDGVESYQSYEALEAQARRVLSGLRSLGLKAGDKVIFQIESVEIYLNVFWGCVLGGIAPLGIAIAPSYAKNANLTKIFNIWAMMGRPLILTEQRFTEDVSRIASHFEPGAKMRVVAVEGLFQAASTSDIHHSNPEDTGLFLLTSGSTGTPKAVVQPHGNLIRRSLAFQQMLAFSADERSFNWLPIDHVTGIVMCHLRDLIANWDQIHAPTALVLQRPLAWLDCLDRFKATLSWAPNFAFRLINDQEESLRAAEGTGRWDLSQVAFLENAGEPIVARTCRRFLSLLAPHGLRPDVIAPAWGMAETCSTVTVSRGFNLLSTSDTDPFTDLGEPFPGFEMRIVNEFDEPVPEGTVGEFQCRGLSVLPGYYENPSANQASYTFDAWFRTGDLAYLKNARLTLTGRAKDVIIMNGMNYYGHEIEAAMDLVEGCEVSYTAAVAIREPGSDTDSLAIFFHTKICDREALRDLIARIRAKSLEFGISPRFVIPVEKDEIPKTGIGKIQRSQLQKRFLEGGFEPHLQRVDGLLANQATIPNWFYRRSLRAKALELQTRITNSGNLLVFLDRLGLGEAMVQEIRHQGLHCLTIAQGETFTQLPTGFVLNPYRDKDYDLLKESLTRLKFQPTHLIHLLNYDEKQQKVSAGMLEEALALGPASLTQIARIFADSGPLQLDLVCNEALPFGDFSPVKGGISPFLRSLQMDFPHWRLRMLDLETQPIVTNLPLVLAEWAASPADSEVVYRSGRRFIPALARRTFEGEIGSLPLVRGGLYLISGGLGALGSLLSLWLHREWDAKLLLIGRSPLVGEHPGMSALEAAGWQGRYCALDLKDADALRELTLEACAFWGCPLSGVFHLAGAMVPEGPWKDADWQARRAESLEAKTLGTWNLMQLLEQDHGIFVSFSSVFGVFGGSNLSAYSAANGILETLTTWKARAGARAFCLSWSAWDGLGLAANMSDSLKLSMMNQGYHMIGKREGLASLKAALRFGPGSTILGVDRSKTCMIPITATDSLPLLVPRVWTRNCDRREDLLAECSTHKDRFGVPLEVELVVAPSSLWFPERGLDPEALTRLLKGVDAASELAMAQDELEQQIAEVWQRVLALDQVPGVNRNFFELGGNSLLSAQVQAALEQLYQLKIETLAFFRFPTIRGLAGFLRGEQDEQLDTPRKQLAKRTFRGQEIAVVGVACRVPGAENAETFWDNLLAGRESIRKLTRDEVAASGVLRELYEDPNYVFMSPVLDSANAFDAAFFGYSPAEAANMDPQQRLFLETAWHALENASCVPEYFGGAIGVYGGALTSTHLIFDVIPNSGYVQPEERIRNLIGNAVDCLATRVSYKLNLTGPSFSVQTNCSTGLVAIHVACSQLRLGECDLALAGGVASRTPEKTGYLYQEGSLSSPDGHCRPFDERAAGTLFGDGVGVVALKRLEDAIAAGDSILAVIKGSAINNDGAVKAGFSAPSIRGQQEVIEAALAQAQVSPATISYVEAHGTATKVGDPIEVRALINAFGGARTGKPFCALGSVKSNIGHLETAAGAVGFIKTVLALHYKKLPPTLHFERPNPLIPFADSPFFVQDRLTDWLSPADLPRRAGVSSFGVGGTNAHAILEEAPESSPDERSEAEGGEGPAFELFPLSAHVGQALDEQCLALAAWLERYPDVALAKVAHSLQVGRRTFGVRRVFVANQVKALAEALREGVGSAPASPLSAAAEGHSAPQVIFLFPGGGSQYLNMGRGLFETEPLFRAELERCAEILAPSLDLLALLFSENREPAKQTRGQAMDEIANMLPLIASLEYALAKLLIAWGIRPHAMIGHSMGEYVAAILAGVFSLEDGLAIVARRSALMQTVPRGAMLVVPLGEAEIRAELGDALSLAVINAVNSCVVSGTPEAVSELEARLMARGMECRRIHISNAAHSHLLDPILETFASFVAQFELHPPQIPYISNITGGWIEPEQATDPRYWRDHLRQTVRFSSGLETLLGEGDTFLLEVGPGHALSGLVGRHPKRKPNHVVVTTIRHVSAQESDREFLLRALGNLWCQGLNLDWLALRNGKRPQKIQLPGYSFQRKPLQVRAETRTAKTEALASRSRLPEQPIQALGRHPFIDYAFQSSINAQACYWEADLAVRRHAYLKEHRVLEETLFPAAGYVESALAVARERFGEIELVLRDFSFEKTLFLPNEGGKHIQLSLFGKENEGQRFQFSSQIQNAQGEVAWERHCQGYLSPAEQLQLPEIKPLDLSSFAANLSFDSSVEDFYRNIAARGIEYGPSFQGLRAIRHGGGSALCAIKAHETLEMSAYRLHPALLDACFQAALTTLPAPLSAGQAESRPFFPTAMGRLRQFAPFSQARWVAVTPAAQEGEVGDDQLVKNLLVVSEMGKPVLEITGFVLRRIEEKHEFKVDDLFYETLWRQQTLSSERKENALQGEVLILADSGGAGRALAQGLESFGVNCLLCEREEQDPELTRLKQIIAEQKEPFTAVVYLWSLDLDRKQAPLEALEWGCSAFLRLTQFLLAREWVQSPRLWLATCNARPGVEPQKQPYRGEVNANAAALWGMAFAIQLEAPGFFCTAVDFGPGLNQAELLLDELRYNHDENQVRISAHGRFVPRLERLALEAKLQKAEPVSGRDFIVEAPTSGVLDELHLRLTDSLKTPEKGEITLELSHWGINFRDLMLSMGLISQNERGDNLCWVGEMVGRVIAIGPQVEGFSLGQEVIAFQPGRVGKHVNVASYRAIPKPENLSAEEAATVIITYLTAWYGLKHLARLKAGERILIHSAAGGVGLAAIAIAKLFGATIFATAGSEEKRAFLQSLGVEAVLNSRTLAFADQIKRTCGGVDVVLSALTGEAVAKNFEVLAPFGRYLEMGVRSIMDSREPGLQGQDRDLSYMVFSLKRLAEAKPEMFRQLLQEVGPLLRNGSLKPLPHLTFPLEQLVPAFHHLNRSKHIGKIVIEMDSRRAQAKSAPIEDFLKPDGTFLITGGMGGLGLAFAEWLASKGVTSIALLGRSAPRAHAKAIIAGLGQLGVQVRAFACDIGDKQSLTQTLAKIRGEMKPLVGIFHAAAVLSDATLARMEPSSFAEVFRAKVQGAWLLDRLTRKDPLCCFVCFSSVVAVLGNAGQVNYAAANAYLDAFVAYRRSQNLPALAINWGSWAEIGLAAAAAVRGKRLASQGLGNLSPDQGLKAMGLLLPSNLQQVAVMNFQPELWVESHPGARTASFLRSFAQSRGTKRAENFKHDLIEATPKARVELLISKLGLYASQVLGVASIHPEMPLTSLGLDSLMSIELRNRIEAGLGIRVKLVHFIKGSSLSKLAKDVLEELNQAN